MTWRVYQTEMYRFSRRFRLLQWPSCGSSRRWWMCRTYRRHRKLRV